MCISVFLWRSHPLYPLLLLLNRDEYHGRPTEVLQWWESGEILGGRDGLAGGTWLACSKNGKIAFVTNVREVSQSVPQPKSRGELPTRFLQGKKNPMEFAEEVMKEANQYNGFNLILADICSNSMVYVTNRAPDESCSIVEVSPGIHVLSNAKLDSPWLKAQRLGASFKNKMEEIGGDEIQLEEMVEKLMMDTTKDDMNNLPRIYPPEWECQLSSIFISAETPSGRYGTRSMSAVSVQTNGECCFYEKHLEEDQWKEKTVTFQISRITSSLPIV